MSHRRARCVAWASHAGAPATNACVPRWRGRGPIRPTRPALAPPLPAVTSRRRQDRAEALLWAAAVSRPRHSTSHSRRLRRCSTPPGGPRKAPGRPARRGRNRFRSPRYRNRSDLMSRGIRRTSARGCTARRRRCRRPRAPPRTCRSRRPRTRRRSRRCSRSGRLLARRRWSSARNCRPGTRTCSWDSHPSSSYASSFSSSCRPRWKPRAAVAAGCPARPQASRARGGAKARSRPVA